ncbi:hypothetical protein [Flavobacterium sp. GCM10027622]|uniref:hypothetical protein n=1 Tax=unclassified Flavobacterium TaxID=196869 RepID=UPI003615D5E4
MKRTIYPSLLLKPLAVLQLCILISCRPSTNEREATENSNIPLADSLVTDLEKQPTATAPTMHWYDTLIADYIKHSEKKLIRMALKNNDSIEWLYDQTIDKDGTRYMLFNIGQDVYDEGYTNKRFVSDGWVYIDSIQRKLYEYDLPNDTIIEWKKKNTK